MAGVVLLARESGRAGRAPAALALAAFAMLAGGAGDDRRRRVPPLRGRDRRAARLGDAARPLDRRAGGRTRARLARGGPRHLAGGPGGDAPGRAGDVRAAVAGGPGRQPRGRAAGPRGDGVPGSSRWPVAPWRCSASRASWRRSLGLPAWLLLHVIVAVVRVAAGLPFAAVAIPPEAGPVGGARWPPSWCWRHPSIVRRVRRATRIAATAPGGPPRRGASDPLVAPAAPPLPASRRARVLAIVAGDRRRALDPRPRRHRRPRDAPRDARCGPGRRDPPREPGRRPDAGGRRTRPRAAAPRARRARPAVGPPDRPRRADASARGPRRRPRPGPGAVPRGPRLRARDARPGAGLGGLGRRAPRRSSAGHAGGGRAAAPGRGHA